MQSTPHASSRSHHRNPRRWWRPLTVAVGAASIGLLASCGGHDHANSAVPDGARTVAVNADGFAFSPETITVGLGEPVAIALTSVDIAHDLNVDAFDGHVYAEAGETATGGFTATTAGEFDFYCSIPGHREAGMEGTLTVEE